eukprot:1159877-Pelagomonas_calceolata.AAC.5
MHAWLLKSGKRGRFGEYPILPPYQNQLKVSNNSTMNTIAEQWNQLVVWWGQNQWIVKEFKTYTALGLFIDAVMSVFDGVHWVIVLVGGRRYTLLSTEENICRIPTRPEILPCELHSLITVDCISEPKTGRQAAAWAKAMSQPAPMAAL